MMKKILQEGNIWKSKKTENAFEIIGVIGRRKYYYHKKHEAEQKYREECGGLKFERNTF